MRESLKQSIADSPATGFERYAKGSIVICNACAKPLFKLDVGITLGDKAGKMVNAFKPVTMADLETLGQRDDIDAGVRAMVKAWTFEQRRAFVGLLREPTTGDPMICPSCQGCFVQVLNVEEREMLDKAYTLELVTIPPAGHVLPIRGQRIGANQGWVH